MDFGEVSLSLNPVNTKQCLCGHGSPHSKVLDVLSCVGVGEWGGVWSWGALTPGPAPEESLKVLSGISQPPAAPRIPQTRNHLLWEFVRKLCSRWANSVCDLSPGKRADHLCNTEILEGAGIALCFTDQCQDKWPRKANVL